MFSIKFPTRPGFEQCQVGQYFFFWTFFLYEIILNILPKKMFLVIWLIFETEVFFIGAGRGHIALLCAIGNIKFCLLWTEKIQHPGKDVSLAEDFKAKRLQGFTSTEKNDHSLAHFNSLVDMVKLLMFEDSSLTIFYAFWFLYRFVWITRRKNKLRDW